MNGTSIADARRAGMIEEGFDPTAVLQPSTQQNNMFVGDDDDEYAEAEQQVDTTSQQLSTNALNPAAAVFSPGDPLASKPSSDPQPKWMTSFGNLENRSPDSFVGPPKGLFGPKTTQQEQTGAAPPVSTQSPFSIGLGATASPFSQPSMTPAATTSTTASVPVPAAAPLLTGFRLSQTQTQVPPFSKAPLLLAEEQEKPAPTTRQPASQGSIFDLKPQGTTASPETLQLAPIFSRSAVSAPKQEIESSRPPQPLFSLTPSSTSAGISGKCSDLKSK